MRAPARIRRASSALLRWLGEGECWVKLSGAHRLSTNAPDYADARSSGAWPHPRTEGEMPDVGHLYELLCDWTPSRATLQRILVSNPATLYGFRG